MDKRRQLTDEELGVECGTRLIVTNLYLGSMLGMMAWIPVSLIYAALQLGFAELPTRNAALAITMGTCIGGGMLISVVAAEKYRHISFRFNRDYLKVYRDGVLQKQILWEDVESVKRGAPYVIQTRQGQTVRVPTGAMISERYENRALKNQLAQFQKPESLPSPKRFAWIGIVSLVIGVPMVSLSKRPFEIFAESDGINAGVWLRILPSILGSLATITGMVYLMMWVTLLGERKKPHPYQISHDGIQKGNTLVRWSDVHHLSCFGANDMQIQFRLFNGPQNLIDCDKYTNGSDLRDAILALAPHSLTQPTPVEAGIWNGKPIVTESWTTLRGLYVFMGSFAVLPLVVAGAAAMGKLHLRTQSDLMGVEGLCLTMFLLVIAVLILSAYRLELTENEIRFQRIFFPQQVIKLDAIDVIEIRSSHGKNGPSESMTVRSKRVSISFGSHLDRYGEIRDIILGEMPTEKVRYS